MKNSDLELAEKMQWEFDREDLKREQKRTGKIAPYGSDGLIPYTRLENDLLVDHYCDMYMKGI